MSRVAFINFILVFLTSVVHGQIGVGGAFANLKAPGWESVTGKSFSSGFSFSVDYALRLKKYRLEFFPGVMYTRSSSAQFWQEPGLETAYVYFDPKFSMIGLKGDLRIYLFDFQGDCNCPTFSKQGRVFQKGFFLRANPVAGLVFTDLKWNLVQSEVEPAQLQSIKEQQFGWGIGVGAGLDIGLSRRLTLTPNLLYEYWPGTFIWSLKRCSVCRLLPDESSISNLQFGLALRFHFKK